MQLTRKQKKKEGIKNLLHCFYNNIASDVYFKRTAITMQLLSF